MSALHYDAKSSQRRMGTNFEVMLSKEDMEETQQSTVLALSTRIFLVLLSQMGKSRLVRKYGSGLKCSDQEFMPRYRGKLHPIEIAPGHLASLNFFPASI